MLRQLLLVVLASAAAARFQGDMTIRVDPGDVCYSFDIHPHDDAFPAMACPYHYGCVAHGDKIATFATECRTNGLHDDSTIEVRPGDELRFCRAGFCSCMRTQYLGTVDEANGRKAASFRFSDAAAYDC